MSRAGKPLLLLGPPIEVPLNTTPNSSKLIFECEYLRTRIQTMN